MSEAPVLPLEELLDWLEPLGPIIDPDGEELTPQEWAERYMRAD